MDMKRSRVRREKENGDGGREEEEEETVNGLLALSTKASAHNLFRDNPTCGH